LVQPSAPWQYLCQWAELGWVVQGQRCHLHLVSLGGPKLLLQLHRHLSEIIKRPYSLRCLLRPGAGRFCVELAGLQQHCPWLALLNATPLCLGGMLLDAVKGMAK